MTIGAETVVFQRAPQLRDAQGNLTPQRDWANATTVTVTGCSVQPMQTADVYGADTIGVVDVLQVIGPRGVDIDVQGGDRTIRNGKPYEVNGEPQKWAKPQGGLHHVVVTIRRQPPTQSGATGTTAALADAVQAASDTQQPWTP